jgi:hypothetical protein
MRHIVIFLFIFGALFIACRRDSTDWVDAQITGIDFRKCVCCGGFFLKTADTTYLFSDSKISETLDLYNAKFPIPVRAEFSPDTTYCGKTFNRIIVNQLELK